MTEAAETPVDTEFSGLADCGCHGAEQLDACERKGPEVCVAKLGLHNL